MSDADWEEALAFLLRQLQEIGASDLAEEINSAVGTLTLVDAAEVEPPAHSRRARRRELGQYAVRRRRADERFHLAISMLTARLVELPALDERIGRWLGVDLADIQFAPDQGLDAGETQSSEFRMPSLAYDTTPGAVQSDVLGLLGLVES